MHCRDRHRRLLLPTDVTGHTDEVYWPRPAFARRDDVQVARDPGGYGMLRALTAIRDPVGAVIINRLAAGRFDDFRGGRARDPARRCRCNRRNSNSTGKREACGRIFSDGNCSTTPICRLPDTHRIESICLQSH
jgi:hypothetical protein